MYNEPKIIILKNKLNVINFLNIDQFSDNKIVLKTINNNIIITGSNLVISKLVTDEVLINGNFSKIEFR